MDMKFFIRKYILILCTLSLLFETKSESLQCKTSYGTIGKCKPISDCESLNKIASKVHLTQKEIHFLRSSKCGEVNNNPLVCCPMQSDYLREVIKKPTEKVLEICSSPFGGNGHCIYTKDCLPILNMLSQPKITENEQMLLNKSKCGGIGSQQICCPKHIPVQPAAKPMPAPLKSLVRNYVPPGESCKTPIGEDGNCDNIYNCPILFNILSKREFSERDRMFLIKSKCGNGDSKTFCCPKQSVTEQNLLKPSSPTIAPQPKTCQTPAGKQGDCKPIRDCRSLFSMLTKPEFTEMDQIHLIKSKCGGYENVCCPKQIQAPPAPFKPLVRTLVFPESQCQTTNGLSGICKFRTDCSLINTPLSDNYQQNNDCGSVNGELQICCPVGMIINDLQFPISVTTTTRVPITTPPPRKLTFPESFCKTPLKENGTCVSIMECDSLLRLETKQSRTPLETMYLEKSVCEKNADRKVCCPISEATRTTTTVSTPRPTTTSPITHTPKTAAESVCETPKGQIGKCISIKRCKSLLNLVSALTPEKIIYLQKSQCGPDNRVCCPLLENRETPTEAPQSATPTLENVEEWTNDPQCGRIALEERIYGGRSTRIDEYPWTTRLIYISSDNDVDYFCGGSLINKNFVLTAAHCVHPTNIRFNWFLKGVRLGEWNTTTDVDCDPVERVCAPPHKDIEYLHYITHPQYKPNIYKNDIALLQLEKSVSPTDFIQPICLPSKSSQARNYDNEEVEVAGWGATETSAHSEVKLKATLRILNSTICENKIRESENKICAKDEKGSDTCYGDSGGPLMYKDIRNKKTSYYLIGIVSFGTDEKCGATDTTGVYTSVAAYMDWIVKEVNNSA